MYNGDSLAKREKIAVENYNFQQIDCLSNFSPSSTFGD